MGDINIARVIIGLVVAIGLIFYCSTRTKIHVFIAMILGSVVAGLFIGLPMSSITSSIKSGFGGTLGSIGIVIGLGVMMGAIFEASGAAKRMAITFINLLGEGKEDIAMAITGFFVAIPVFCDSAFVILTPLAKSLSRKTGRSVVTIGCALGAALLTTHSLVPPTPGPLAISGYFALDMGKFILLGLLFSIPISIAGIIYARWVGKKIYRVPDPNDNSMLIDRPYTEEELKRDIGIINEDDIPSAFLAFLPIALPIFLILLNTVAKATGMADGTVRDLIALIGDPVVAVMIGLLVSIFTLARKIDRKEVVKLLDKSIEQASVIVFVTGAGGALGQVLKDSGAGIALANMMLSSHIPGILLPFFMAYLLRIVTGSATVGMLTAGSLTAPIILEMATVNPYLAGLACCIGSIGITNVHDSYFWVVNKSIGLTEMNDMFKNWFGCVLTMSTVGFVFLMIGNIFM
jgi:GntP family gluconate:H+ symporter